MKKKKKLKNITDADAINANSDKAFHSIIRSFSYRVSTYRNKNGT